METLGIFFILILVGFFAGSHIEKKHLADLHDREYRTRQLPVINIGAKTPIIRFATSSLTQGAAELFVYGTAVQID
ncbi:MAG: hypothetical protein AAF773_08685 [Cyanobacteria bacterium P01_D01_bin.115]